MAPQHWLLPLQNEQMGQGLTGLKNIYKQQRFKTLNKTNLNHIECELYIQMVYKD
jgi:hypothetical protein